MLNLLGRSLLLGSGLAPVALVIAFLQLLFGGVWIPWAATGFAMIGIFGFLVRHGDRNLQFQYLDMFIVKPSPLFTAMLVGLNVYTFETDDSSNTFLVMTRSRFQTDVRRRLRTVRLTPLVYLHVKEPHE